MFQSVNNKGVKISKFQIRFVTRDEKWFILSDCAHAYTVTLLKLIPVIHNLWVIYNESQRIAYTVKDIGYESKMVPLTEEILLPFKLFHPRYDNGLNELRS